MHADRLAALEPRCSTADALAFFDSLPAVRAEEMFGRYKGREIATGHPMNGTLAASGWYGKQFDDLETVHPLVMTTGGGKLFALDPRKIPMGLAEKVPPSVVAAGHKLLSLFEPLVGTTKPRARLRHLEHRGVVTAAMIYDHLPIIDVFRRVDERTLLGLMDQRRDTEPLFFVLERE